MKITVLGAAGLLGRPLVEELQGRGHEVLAVTRSDVDLSRRESALRFLGELNLDWIVNAAGVVKSRTDYVQMALVNAGLPHWLEELDAKLLHVSTDCVFSGAKGFYSEDDEPDPVDVYGATKAAGEVFGPRSTTVRTSFVGWGSQGLLNWLTGPKVEHRSGFRQVLWSGLSAREVARALCLVVEEKTREEALYHLSGRIISKHQLLCLLAKHLHLGIDIDPVDEPVLDRSLDGRRFANRFGYSAPDWATMAEELASEQCPTSPS